MIARDLLPFREHLAPVLRRGARRLVRQPADVERPRGLGGIRLRSYLVLLVLAAILPLLGFSVFMVIGFSRQQDARVEQSLIRTARTLAIAVDRQVAGDVSELIALAAFEDLGTRVDLPSFDAKARRVLRNEPLWRAVVLSDATGQELVNTSVPFGARLPSLADRPLMREALATGKPAMGPFVLGHVTNTPIAPILVPVTSQGRVRYVLEAAYNPRALARLLARQVVPPGGIVSLIDRRGIVMARSRDSERFVGRPAPPELLRRATDSREGAARVTTLDGVEAYAAFSKAPVSGWTVALAIPASEVAGLPRRSIWMVLGGALSSVILGVGLATLLGRGGVRSIASLVAAARALGRGEDFAKPVSFITELGELGGAMERAATERRLALAEALRRVQQQAAVAGLGRRALTGLDASALAHEAVAVAAKVLDTRYAYVLERLSEPASLSLRAGVGWEAGSPGEAVVRIDGEVRAFYAALERGPLILERIEEASSGPVSFLRDQGAVSALWTAIRGRGFVVGILGVAATSRRRFTAEDGNFLRAIANVLAGAIARLGAEQEQSVLLLEERKARATVATLADLGRLLSQALESDQVMRQIVDNCRTLLSARSTALYLLAQGPNKLVVRAVSQTEDCHVPWPAELSAGTGLAGLALREGAALVSADVLHDPRVALPAETVRDLEGAADRAGLAVPLFAHGQRLGVLAVADRTGKVFEENEVELATAFATHAALAIRNARLFGESQHRRRVAAHLAAVGRLVSQSLDSDLIGQRIADSARALFGVQAAVVFQVEQGTGNLVAIASAGPGRGTFGDAFLSPGCGLAALALRELRPVASADMLADSRICCSEDARAALDAAGLGAGLIVPFIAGDRVIGGLAVGDWKGRAYSDDDVALVQLLADQATVALENARLFREVKHNLEETKQLAEALRSSNDELQRLWHRLVETQEDERRGLARELHDQIGQIVTTLKMTVKLALRTASGEASERLKGADELVDDLLRRVRRLSLDLRPPLLDDLGLLPALLWHFDQYTARSAVRVAFTHRGLDHRLRPELETGAYRIIQEALTNVARHGGTDEVTVSGWADGEHLRIEIDDRGMGFTPEEELAAGRSTGLSGMQERAVVLGGRCHIESSPGNGTHLSISLPLADGSARGRGRSR